MADSDNKSNNLPDFGGDEYSESPLVDIFGENGLDATRRVSLDGEEAQQNGSAPDEDYSEIEDIEERDYRPVRMRRSSRLGCLGGLMYAVFIICVSVILACGGWMAASDVLALGKDEISAAVTLPKSAFEQIEREVKDDDGNVTGTETVTAADIDYVAEQLKDNGIIEYKWLFKLFAKISHADTKIDPGTYQLSTRFDYRALVKNMQVGTEVMVTTTLTFPEGYTMAQIFQKLEDNDICETEKLYDAAANFNYSYTFLEGVETGDAQRLEGFIFPNTYDFYQGEQASSVINKFLAALHYNITADNWKQCENLGISFKQAVTIASMIEKEAANDDERSMIASVIYNRLNAGMPLGIDATILYEFPDYDGGVNLPEEIRSYDSPYNTNLHTGLPPTPICNPGMASIRAALKPASTGYYYYALDTATGTHRFFTNVNEFNSFVATQNYE